MPKRPPRKVKRIKVDNRRTRESERKSFTARLAGMDPKKKRLAIVLFMAFVLFGSGLLGGMLSGLGVGGSIDLSKQYLGPLSPQEEKAVVSTGRTLVVVGEDQNLTLVASVLSEEFYPLRTRDGLVYPVHYSTRANATGIIVRNATTGVVLPFLDRENLTRTVCESLGDISGYYPACIIRGGL